MGFSCKKKTESPPCDNKATVHFINNSNNSWQIEVNTVSQGYVPSKSTSKLILTSGHYRVSALEIWSPNRSKEEVVDLKACDDYTLSFP